MSSVLYSLGRWAFRARRLMLAVWVVVLIALIAGAGLLSTGTNNTYAIPGTESQTALDALARTFPQVSGASAQLIVVAPAGDDVRQPAFQTPIENEIGVITAIPQVLAATSPYASTTKGNISSGSKAALVPIQLSVVSSAVTSTTTDALQQAGASLRRALPAGSQVAVGGQVFSQTAAGISVTELLGVLVALIVLIFTFASVVAAGMPLITALLGVGCSLAVILMATRFMTITSTTPLLALMLGLAVGIDYALFIVSRHQDQVKEGVEPEESAARAVATAGSAVVFAAVTVIIALLGLSVAQIPFLTTMGVAAAFAVAVAVLVSTTLTPALLGFAGIRIVRKRYRPATAVDRADSDVVPADAEPAGEEPAGEVPAADVPTAALPAAALPADALPEHGPTAPHGFFFGWVRGVTKWPIVTVVVIIAALGLLTVPAGHLRLALPDAGSLEPSDPGRITYDLVSKYFGPGYNGPLIVTGSIIQSTDPVGLMNSLGTEIAAVPGVASVPISTPNQPGDTGIVQVIPTGGPDSQQTKDLVARLRALHGTFEKEHGVDLSVTGYTAAGIDISARLEQALLPFVALVVGLSLVLLAMVFRSIVVPVTAALGYLLSIGAAFGVTSLVFENGFLAEPLGVHALGAVISFMPIILMGVLFGLAMDYEVFLVSRMREDYVHHRDARAAVERGFVGSARVVTAAAIIMFAVFAAFIPEGDASIQPIALGLAVGVTIDAFVVRMSLIPAVLRLFGHSAWWIPAWLDRALPSFDVEGEGLHKELEIANWPEAVPSESPAASASAPASASPSQPEPARAIAIAAEQLTVSNSARVVVEGLNLMVPTGDVLVVSGGAESGKTSLLLTLAGRLRRMDGRVKVDGLALPMRASTVRSRVGVARLSEASDPVAAVRAAVTGHPPIVMIDDLDLVTHPADREEVAQLLDDAVFDAHDAGFALTLVVSVTGGVNVPSRPAAPGLDELLPPGAVVHRVELSGAPTHAADPITVAVR